MSVHARVIVFNQSARLFLKTNPNHTVSRFALSFNLPINTYVLRNTMVRRISCRLSFFIVM
jgi:hypothetical protein